jgi:anti-sigma B factor antagonist
LPAADFIARVPAISVWVLCSPEREEIIVVAIDIEDRGKIKIIKIKGEFFLGYVRQVEETWNKLVAANPEVMAIDCCEMTFVDSSAIGTFVKFLHYSMAHNIKLVFFDLNESISRIFNKAKLNKIFAIHTRDEFEKLYAN